MEAPKKATPPDLARDLQRIYSVNKGYFTQEGYQFDPLNSQSQTASSTSPPEGEADDPLYWLHRAQNSRKELPK